MAYPLRVLRRVGHSFSLEFHLNHAVSAANKAVQFTPLSSGTGSLVQTCTFDSFGKQTNSSGALTNPFQYAGREFDPETGLYYYRARYYDQTTGRFIGEDPVFYGFTNFYAYVAGNPVRWQDPLGLWQCDTGTSCKDLHPDLKNALTNLENCAGLPPGQPLTITCGTTGHQPKVVYPRPTPANPTPNGTATGDPHFYGVAVDIGHNSNPGLSPEIFEKCFKLSFPQKQRPTRTWGSYAQREYNSKDPNDGWHYHIQYFGSRTNGEGFSADDPIHPHGQ